VPTLARYVRGLGRRKLGPWAQIDRTHTLARGLQNYLLFTEAGGGTYHDLAGSANFVPGATTAAPAWDRGPPGVGLKFAIPRHADLRRRPHEQDHCLPGRTSGPCQHRRGDVHGRHQPYWREPGHGAGFNLHRLRVRFTDLEPGHQFDGAGGIDARAVFAAAAGATQAVLLWASGGGGWPPCHNEPGSAPGTPVSVSDPSRKLRQSETKNSGEGEGDG
jgi:hypothetical protein